MKLHAAARNLNEKERDTSFQSVNVTSASFLRHVIFVSQKFHCNDSLWPFQCETRLVFKLYRALGIIQQMRQSTLIFSVIFCLIHYILSC